MFDMSGEVIGIVSYILTQSGSFEGVGFAVTSNTAQELLLARRSPWSGITFFGLSGMLAKVFNLPQSTGVLVQRVAEGSPGQRLGLRPSFLPARIGKHQLLLGGDVILEIDGIQADSPATDEQIRQHLAELKRGADDQCEGAARWAPTGFSPPLNRGDSKALKKGSSVSR